MRRLSLFLPKFLSLPLIAIVLLPAARGHAQENAAAEAAGYEVRGTVVNSATGQPVPRALVDLNEQYAMLTGGDGQFSFDDIPAGMYMVTVRKPGFRGFGNNAQEFNMRGALPVRSRAPRRIQVGPDMPALTFRITPEATIMGTVTLSTADPADGIQVMLYRRELQNGHSRWAEAGVAKTRSDGSFRIPGLLPGTYIAYTQASLDRPQAGTNAAGPVFGYPAVYYPGVTDTSAAGMLTVGAGQQVEADFTLTRQQFFPVTALVRSADEEMATDFQILDSGGRLTWLPARFDRQTQLVHAAVPNGTWTLQAHAYGHNQGWGRTEFQVAGAPVTFAISLVPVPRIPVIIHRDFTASNSADQPANSHAGMNLYLTPADEVGTGAMGGNMMPSHNNDGTWELNVLQPGRYWAIVDPYPPAYVSSITMGGLDLAANPVVVSPGSSLAPIEVTLRDDPGSIAGQVNLRDQAAPGSAGEQQQIWIYAIPLFPSAGDVQNLMPSDTGQFTFYHVAPGSWRVVACDSEQDIDSHSPEGLAVWAGKGQTVTVDPGGTANVQLDVIHMETAP